MFKLATFNKGDTKWVLFFSTKDRALFGLVRDLLYTSKGNVQKITKISIWVVFEDHGNLITSQVEIMGYVRKLLDRNSRIRPRRWPPSIRETLH